MKRIFLALSTLFLSGSFASAGEAVVTTNLNVGTLQASIVPPQSWGSPKTITPESAEAAEVSLPIMQEMPYAAAIWPALVPKDPSSELQPVTTVTVLDLSAGFADDKEMKLPADERSPIAMSAKDKEATIAPLKKIFAASTVDVEKLRSDDMDQNMDLIGAWWGGIVGALEIVDVHYIENADKSLRGISYLYTEGGDINFNLGSRIVLYSPELKTVIVYDLPLYSFPEIQKFNQAVGAAGEGPAVLEQFRKGVAFVRDRKQWESTPMGKLIEQLDAMAKGTEAKRK